MNVISTPAESKANSVLIAIPVLLIGGTEVQTLHLLRALTGAGYPVTVCCYYEYDAAMVAQFEEAGAKVYLMKYARAKGLWHLAKGLIKLFRTLKPDIVHVQYIAPGFLPVLAAKLTGVKTIFATVHQPSNPYGLKAKLFLRIAAMFCTAFFCNSLAVEKSWFGSAEFYQPEITKFRRHCTIYNAVDTEAIAKAVSGADRTALCLQLGIDKGPIVGIVARLRWEKGHDLLLAAFPEVLNKFPDAQLLIVGDGPDRESLKLKVASLELKKHIIWLGQKSPEEVYRLYSVMDVVVVPSRFEGFGFVAAEAMAAGRPVVASKVDGLAEVVEDNFTGFLVPGEDSTVLAKAITRVLSNPSEAKFMGLNGKKRVAQLFSMNIFLNKTLGAYEYFFAT